VSSVDQVLQHALVRPLVPIEWRDDEPAALPPPKPEDGRPSVSTH
jgi:hypothetical protein